MGKRVSAVAAIVMLLSACATIPAEAPVLSAQLSSRISESKRAHEDVVRLFFEMKRAEVDRFVATEWLPVFAGKLFEQPAVQLAWNEVVRSQEPVTRVDFIRGLGPRLQAQINERRTEMLKPLEEMEREALRALEHHYNEMIAVNATLTGLLRSGARASETQEAILRGLRADSALHDALGRATEVTRLMTKAVDGYEKNQTKIDELVSAARARGGK
jgi:hypothetical protein